MTNYDDVVAHLPEYIKPHVKALLAELMLMSADRVDGESLENPRVDAARSICNILLDKVDADGIGGCPLCWG